MVMARIGFKRFNDPYSEPYDFFSPHPGLVSFLWADGSVRPIQFDADWMVVGSVATRAGLERVTPDF
jgi:prepilin-type processing-associated H-X9-DG protein